MLENNPHINDIGIIQGSKDDFVELLNYISNNNIIQNTHYDYVDSKIDIDQYINYQICELFFANRDWPMNNQKYWKSKEENSRWRWILYDLEYMIVKKILNLILYPMLSIRILTIMTLDFYLESY